MFVVVLVVVALLTIYFCIKDRSGEPFMFFLFFGLMGSLLTALIIDAPVSWIMRDRAEFSYDLGALNDGRSTQGSFFLGSGTIDSVPSFMYYERDGDGYVLRDWPASSSKVVETKGDPQVVYNCYDYSSVPRPFRWAPQMMEDGSVYDCRHAFVTFYVPPGSVQQQYILDAQ